MNLLKGEKVYFDKEGVELSVQDLEQLRAARLRECQAVWTVAMALLALLVALLAGASVAEAAWRGLLVALIGTWPIRLVLQMFWWGIEERGPGEARGGDE